MSFFAQTTQIYAEDALRAFPAAVARICLGWKAEPAIRRLATSTQKMIAIFGSIGLGVCFGELARKFPASAGWADLVVMAVAFNAQHICNRVIALSNPAIRRLEKQARDRFNKRYSDHDDD